MHIGLVNHVGLNGKIIVDEFRFVCAVGKSSVVNGCDAAAYRFTLTVTFRIFTITTEFSGDTTFVPTEADGYITN